MKRPVYKYFAKEEAAQIRKLWAEGLSAESIGKRVGRTKNSVHGYLYRNMMRGHLRGRQHEETA